MTIADPAPPRTGPFDPGSPAAAPAAPAWVPGAPSPAAPTGPAAAPEAPSTDDADISRRGLRMRPIGIGLVGLATIAFLLWLAADQQPELLMIAIALTLVLVLDGVMAHRSLADFRLELRAPGEAIAARNVSYYARPVGLRRPVEISRPGTWPLWRTPPVVIDSTEAGQLMLTAPPRGVVRYLVFDAVGHGPLGTFESLRRIRVWLPDLMHIGPPPLEHDVDWPRQRTIRFGEHEVSKVGDDLFRGTRPYVPGDSQRSVHWPATAHHGQLMVRETDGLGMIALRIVLHLPGPSTASEIAAGRAAWLAEEGARRGWLVQLVTMASVGAPPPPPPLLRPTGPIPLAPPAARYDVPVSRRVHTKADITRQLAFAGYGMPPLEKWQGITRIVSPYGDEWQ